MSNSANSQNSAIDSLSNALAVTPDDSLRVEILSNLVDKLAVSQPTQAIRYGLEGLRIAKEEGFVRQEGTLVLRTGVAYIMHGDLENALYAFQSALDIFQEAKDTTKLASTYNNIGNLNLMLDRKSEATEFYKQALHYSRLTENWHLYGLTLNNIGNIYNKLDSLDKAEKYLKTAIHFNDSLGFTQTKLISKATLADVKVKREDYRAAIDDYQEVLDSLTLLFEPHHSIPTILKDLGEAFYRSGSVDSAIYYTNLSLSKAKEYELREDIKDAHKSLADLYSLKGQYNNSVTNFEKYDSLRQLLYGQQKDAVFKSFQLQQEAFHQENKITLLNQKNAFNEQLLSQERSLRYLFIVLILFFIFILFLLFRNNQKNQRMNQLLAEKYKLSQVALEKESIKAKFDALKQQINPHFLFNSLSVLSSLVKKKPADAEDFIVHLSRIYHHVLTNIDHDLISLHDELDFLNSYINALKLRFRDSFFVEFSNKEFSSCKLLPPMTLQILIENAIKHNFFSKEEPLYVWLIIKDKSLTVKNKINPKKESYSSTGLGLQIIRERYRILGGDVDISKSEEYFEVTVPLVRHKEELTEV